MIPSSFLLATLQAPTAPSSSVWHNILASLPVDPASVVTLALALGVAGLVVYAGIRSNGKGKGSGGVTP